MQSQNRKKRQRAKRKEKQDRRLEKVSEMLKLKRHDWVVMNNYT